MAKSISDQWTNDERKQVIEEHLRKIREYARSHENQDIWDHADIVTKVLFANTAFLEVYRAQVLWDIDYR